MSPAASLRTGGRPRRTLLAILLATLVALGVAIGPGTAHASTSSLFIPAQYVQSTTTFCNVSGWPNGAIWCGTGIGINFPNNGGQEVFGNGENEAVWTDWGTEAHPSGWKSLGGQCGNSPLGLNDHGDYSVTLFCDALHGPDYWYNTRGYGANGTWGGWKDTGVPYGYQSELGSGILWSDGTTQ